MANWLTFKQCKSFYDYLFSFPHKFITDCHVNRIQKKKKKEKRKKCHERLMLLLYEMKHVMKHVGR